MPPPRQTIVVIAALAIACASSATQRTAQQPADVPLLDPALKQRRDELFLRARELEAAQNHAMALSALDEAITLDPMFGLAHLHRGDNSLLVGRPAAEVRTMFERAVALLSDNPRAHLRLAEVCVELSDSIAAERHFRRALALRRDSAEAHFKLAVHLERTGTSEPNEVRKLLEAATQLAPSDVQIGVSLGEYFTRSQDHRRAAEAFERIARATGTSAPLFRKAEAAYVRAGNRERAEQMQKTADRLDPPPKEKRMRPLKERSRAR